MRQPSSQFAAFVFGLLFLFIQPGALAATVGKKFPPFTGKDAITGASINLEDLKGKVVLVDFWATWCGPCVQEIPNVKSVHDEFGDKGFIVVSISLDSDKARCKSFIKDRGMNWLHIVDGGGWQTRLAKKYGINSIPKMYLIDHNGVCISDSARGERLSAEVERAIKKIPPARAGQQEQNDEDAKQEKPASQKPPKKIDPDPPAPTFSPAELEDMQAQLDSAKERLEHATVPLSKVVSRIEAAQAELPRIDGDLPSPKRASSTREAYLRVRSEILDLRRDMFAIGLLNQRSITVPIDPFMGKPQSDLQAFFQAKSQIPIAVRALEEMKQIASSELGAVGQGRVQLAGVAEKLKEGRGPVEQIKNECDQVCAAAVQLSEHWSRSWQDQLRRLHEVVVQINSPATQLAGRFDLINAQLNTITDHLAKGELTESRQQFALMCEDLRELTQQVQVHGLAKQVKQPSNPFERRRSDDRVLTAEAELQLKVAREAVQHLRSAVLPLTDSGRQRAETFLPRIKELQEELANNADPKASDLHERYKAICGEILLAQEKNS